MRSDRSLEQPSIGLGRFMAGFVTFFLSADWLVPVSQHLPCLAPLLEAFVAFLVGYFCAGSSCRCSGITRKRARVLECWGTCAYPSMPTRVLPSPLPV